MSGRFIAVFVTASVVLGSVLVGAEGRPQMSAPQDHLAWVAALLERMQSIKPGVTREQVLEVFAMHSGQSGLLDTVINRDCPYFVADVQYEQTSPLPRDAADPLLNWRQGRLIKISKPYLDAGWGAHASLNVVAPPSQRPDYVAWVGEVLASMQTITPGMTRAGLLKVFTTEGGLSMPLQRTFVSRDCRYFKVDVTFEAVGRPGRDSNGRETNKEDGRDIIVKISRPYLAFAVID
jgi:hypothetical protein